MKDRPQADRTLPRQAERAGLKPDIELHMDRRLRLGSNLKDARALARYVDRQGIDIVHCHSSFDHMLAAAARKLARRNPKIVRTNYQGRPISARPGERVLLSCATDGYLCFSRRVLAAEKLPPKRCAAWIDPALRLDRYPALPRNLRIRKELGVSRDGFLFGMVMRVQAHRRFDVVIDAVERALRDGPFQVLVFGRGTHLETLAVRPVRERGLGRVIRFAGYVTEGYVEKLAAFDALIYLRPGSDGTARALREVQAIGRPAIVSDHGILPDLVQDRRTGRVVPLDPAAVAAAMAEMVGAPHRTREMGRAARRTALERYDLRRQATAVREFYLSIP